MLVKTALHGAEQTPAWAELIMSSSLFSSFSVTNQGAGAMNHSSIDFQQLQCMQPL